MIMIIIDISSTLCYDYDDDYCYYHVYDHCHYYYYYYYYISSSSRSSSSSSSARFGPVRGVLGLRVLRQLERVDVVLRIRTMNLLGWLRLGWLEIARNRPRPCYAGFVFSPIVLYYCCFSLLCCSLFPFFLATKISKSYAQSPY